MQTRIKKWGNSLALLIPQSVADLLNLQPDTLVSLTVNGTDLTVSSLRQTPETLEKLLAGVTEHNLHGEVNFVPAIGKEAW